MSNLLLEKTRKLNNIIQLSGKRTIAFSDLTNILKDVLDANIYVASKRGKILGISLVDNSDSPLIFDETTGTEHFSENDNKELLKVESTIFNVTEEKLVDIFKNDKTSYSKFATIVPIIGRGERIGTLIVARGSKYSDDDLILAEYAATVVGMEIIRAKNEADEEEARKKAIVQMAIGTLSYSEFEAIEHIFKELDGDEGLLVASKIADRVGITRSVIVNALRKFESAGVIESRSLGMKGTYIKVLNKKLFAELEKLNK
ncbi:GTP-sensing pleiotropic transcriptional regulator CodY [Helicovermis profundi]|uniref:Global transcriptional regulator CodY n=1 Tax=Helicovermis profundi TaxID=3065157 RepID=A0AAU9E418_9FIRM|nr:GTP-sensing pleiotropic transcriptional regulator CodY [Clostridia bacterium S502]